MDTWAGGPGGALRIGVATWSHRVATQTDREPEVVIVARTRRLPPEHGDRQIRVAAALTCGVVAGALMGWLWGMSSLGNSPSPAVAVTLDTFPQELLGEPRQDRDPPSTGSDVVGEQLDAFERQLVAHRFAYGGDGATLRYGGRLSLTIVNGILTPSVPRLGSIGSSWRGNQPRRLVSLRSTDVRCVFEPTASIESLTNTGDLGGLDSEGRTECVLLDIGRHLSLRIDEVAATRGADAVATAHRFRDELRRIHADLVG